MTEVWVTGMGAISAAGASIEDHRAALGGVTSCLAPRTFFDHAQSELFAGTAPASCIDPDLEATAGNRANVLLDHALGDALADAGVENGCRADIYMGATLGNMHAGTAYYQKLCAGGQPSPREVRYFLPASPLHAVASSRRLTGVRRTLSSACASSAIAIGRAFRRIQTGASQRCIAGGFDPLCPFVVAGFTSLRLLAAGMCKPFDQDRDGLCPGEGAAALVLESPQSASERARRPLAILAGYGEALEGYHHTRSHPHGEGLARAMAQALRQARLEPGDIDLIHLHGTATVANDQSEYAACKAVFGKRLSAVAVTSTKWITGHTFGAAGALGACFAILSLSQSIHPAIPVCQTIDPAFEGLTVCRRPEPLSGARWVMATALGFGGEAAALLFAKPEGS
jgi:3-oxoacyl-(acyl-carrier-protein) synthase